MYLTRVNPACFPLLPFLGVAIVRVALACFPNFHVLYLPQARPRADCCTPGYCLCIVLATLNFCFAQSSRANGVEQSGQTTCGLLHTCHVIIILLYFFFVNYIFFLSSPGSHNVHVRTGLIFYLFIPIAQSSRANGVDIFFIYTYSTKFTCERGWFLFI